jgi:hypothetical protein
MGLNEKCLGEGGTRALFITYYMEPFAFVYQVITELFVGDLLTVGLLRSSAQFFSPQRIPAQL